MSTASTIINKFGKMAGWNSITVNMLGRDVEGINELEYDDNVEMDVVRGQGMYPIGYSEGNYEAKASISLYNEEWNGLQKSLPPGHGMHQIAPFPIVVEYEYDGFKIKDTFVAKIKGRGIAVKQGDKTIAYKAELLVLGKILWNV